VLVRTGFFVDARRLAHAPLVVRTQSGSFISMQQAGKNKTPFGARIFVGAAACALVSMATAVHAQPQAASGASGTVAQGRVTAMPVAPTPPMPQGASIPHVASAPERALPAMPVPMPAQASSEASAVAEGVLDVSDCGGTPPPHSETLSKPAPRHGGRGVAGGGRFAAALLASGRFALR